MNKKSGNYWIKEYKAAKSGLFGILSFVFFCVLVFYLWKVVVAILLLVVISLFVWLFLNWTKAMFTNPRKHWWVWGWLLLLILLFILNNR